MSDLLPLLHWFIGVSGAGAVITFIARAAMTHAFSRDLERFRSDLQRNSSLEIEKLRSALERERAEHDLQFRWLHTRRAHAIEQLHAAWITSVSAIAQAANTASLVHQLGRVYVPQSFIIPVDDAQRAYLAFDQQFRAHRPILTRDLESALQGAKNSLERILFEVKIYQTILDAQPNRLPDAEPAAQREMQESATRLTEQLAMLPALEVEVVRLFRSAFDAIAAPIAVVPAQ
jgi:hypothetical protein